MAQHFDARNAPFDRLSDDEIGLVRDSLDIAYFRPNETIIGRDRAPDNLYIVIKGVVEERDGDDLIALRGPGDTFDSRALVQGQGSNAFVAREETLCNLLPRDVTLRLINQNPRFASFFYLDIGHKLDAVSREEEGARFAPLLGARVEELFLHPAQFVEGKTSIAEAGTLMRRNKSYALFVRGEGGEGVGMLTRTDLLDAAICDRRPIEGPVGPLAHRPIVCVASDDLVSTALLKMTKHNKRRVAVAAGGNFIGVLEDIDLLSFLAGNSQLVAGRIDRASSVADLARAARKIDPQIRTLRRQGVKIDVVREIVSDLNRHLHAKLFSLVAPQSIREFGCLIVMGSEGRGEQTFRTDQDNGLILAAAVPAADLETFRAAVFDALEQCGFPPCPGEVMVRNPVWSKTLDEYRDDFRGWLALGDESGTMNVAIFYDAEATAGDADLLRAAKQDLIDLMRGERVHLARFARAIDAFPTPIGFFNNLVTSKAEGDALDLKKGGIFPIVHGVRALSLERGLHETGTTARIAKLAELGAFDAQFARELTQALRYLMTLRLDAQIAEAHSTSLVKPGELSPMERDLLRDAFQVVKRLRELVRRHFNLAMF
ncbi:MAG TPA: putative nucleotidyltransferase substrate binding domain-containing protein [Roseiarcus sp.]|nr:putative nucleotidyltransferase substrate binding domain-containing protein [Roseiarcus sp.]